MMKTASFAACLAIAATAAQAQHFSAADVPGAGIKQSGIIVIRNDAKSITAFRFFQNVREALLTLQSERLHPMPNHACHPRHSR